MADEHTGKPQQGPPYEPTAAEAAVYIEQMLAGLHEITKGHRELAMLAYILSLARQEATVRANGPA